MKVLSYILAILFPACCLAQSMELDPQVSRSKTTKLYGATNADGDTIVAFMYDHLSKFSESYAVAKLNDRFFFIDGKGKRKSNKDYEYVIASNNGISVFAENNKYGLIDHKEEITVKPIYDYLINMNNGFVSATMNKKKGMINRVGEVIIPIEYEALLPKMNLLFVKKEGKFAMADTLGNFKTAFKYDRVGHRPGDKYVTMEIDREEFYFNHDGPLYFDFEISSKFTEGRALVTQDDLYGYINEKFELIIPCQFNYAKGFKNGNAIVKNNFGSFGLIDSMGEFIYPIEYKMIRRTSDSLLSICKTETVRILGPDFNPITNEVYELGYSGSAYELKDGLIQVVLGGKIAFIDATGKLVRQTAYDKILDVYKGVRLVQQDKKWGVVDPDFKEVVPCNYNYINSAFGHEFYVVQIKGEEPTDILYGLYKRDKMVLDPIYREINILDHNKVEVMEEEEWKQIEF